MKRVIAGLLLVPVLATAQEVPLILGTLPNRDNSKITFTTYAGECKDGNRLVYAQGDGGKIEVLGCYRMVGDDLMVVWNDGEVYSYPLDDVRLSTDMQEWLKRNR